MERVISKKPQQDRSATHEPGTGYFKKGHTPIARGRPKGIQNRLSRDVKTAILTAAEQVGEDGEGRGGLGRCPVPADPVSALAGRPIASRPRIAKRCDSVLAHRASRLPHSELNRKASSYDQPAVLASF